MEIKSCKYNADNDTIEVIVSNRSKISILCAAVEESLSTTITSRSKLVWLKGNEPSTYAELVITDRLQGFLDRYDECYYRQQDTIERQLAKHFNGDKAYAAAIAREIMMYGE